MNLCTVLASFSLKSKPETVLIWDYDSGSRSEGQRVKEGSRESQSKISYQGGHSYLVTTNPTR